MTLGISVMACVLRPPFALCYSLVAGLLQALTLRFSLRQHRLEMERHCLCFLPGALASSILLTLLGLKTHLTGYGPISVLEAFLTWVVISWLGLICLLMPATRLGCERSIRGDIMSRERALAVHSAMLIGISLTCLLLECRPDGLVSAGRWLSDERPMTRDLAAVFLCLSALSLAFSTVRTLVKTLWLGRVRRGRVPGWLVVPGAAADFHAVLPRGGGASGLPRWDALSDSAIEGALVFGGQEGVTFRDPSSHSAVPVALLGEEARRTPLSWAEWPLIPALVFLLAGFGTWFLRNMFRLTFYR
jgi:hypothetical protein